ncbi:MAG TPA: outer membrane lipoprotein carrier protein LolA [Bryobacteraceae bacterium]|nr:outer membrane lipoprotein carrier protein LolA [Bryobacteraceae bacterium]
MRLHSLAASVFLALSLALSLSVLPLVEAAPPNPKEALQAVLERMDRAAGEFKAMTAQVSYVTHTDVLNEDSTETGTVAMQKVQPGEVRGLVEFISPDRHTVTFEKRRVQHYYPKIKTLEVYDLGDRGEQLDRFFMIGFGNSGTELAKDYGMKLLGTETMKGSTETRAVRLQLIPKSGEAQEYLKSVELWIPEQGDPYPLREKILQPSGDYRLVIYSDLKINPALKPDALQLKLPAGVKTVYPGK